MGRIDCKHAKDIAPHYRKASSCETCKYYEFGFGGGHCLRFGVPKFFHLPFYTDKNNSANDYEIVYNVVAVDDNGICNEWEEGQQS